MNTKLKQKFYTSPSVEVKAMIEMEASQVICQSVKIYQDDISGYEEFEW